MKHKLFALLFALVFALAAGCSPNGGGSQDTGGKLVLSLSMQQSPSSAVKSLTPIAKTLLPPIDMNPAEYIVTGAGPGGATFSETTTDETLVVENLAFGDWTIQADAHNLDDTLIGRGTGTATVHTGEDTYADVIVRPIEGFGTLNLTVNWTAGDVENPSIDAQLIPYSGTAMTLGFTLGTGTASYSNMAIPTGYYTLILKLLDNGINVMGAVEVVRIVNEQVTTGTYDFPEVNTPGGGLIVTITPEMDDPLTVTMTGQVAELAQNQSMAVTASVAEAVGNVIYVWYINGNAVATGETYTASGLALGVYRLDVTAFTADGRRAGSATWGFYVVEEIQTQKKLLPSDGTGSQYFGLNLATSSDGNAIVVGAHGVIGYTTGSAYLYKNNNNSWQETKLRALDNEGNTLMGYGTSITPDGNIVIVGTPYDDNINSISVGSIHIYEWNNNIWQETIIESSDGQQELYFEHQFGLSTSISSDGNTIIVGAPRINNWAGAAYLYKREDSDWREYKILASELREWEQFGQSVSISADGSKMVIGTNASNISLAYIYEWINGTLVETATLRASDVQNNDLFGSAVSMSSDGMSVIIGAPAHADNNVSCSGAAYIFKWNGNEWQVTKLSNPNGYFQDFFGSSVSISNNGNIATIGAYGEDFNGDYSGSAYIFKWDGSEWDANRLLAFDGRGGDFFGQYVAISSNGSVAVVGSPLSINYDNWVSCGAAYVFNLNSIN